MRKEDGGCTFVSQDQGGGLSVGSITNTDPIKRTHVSTEVVSADWNPFNTLERNEVYTVDILPLLL